MGFHMEPSRRPDEAAMLGPLPGLKRTRYCVECTFMSVKQTSYIYLIHLSSQPQ